MAPIKPETLQSEKNKTLLVEFSVGISQEDNLKSPTGEGPFISLVKLEKRREDLKTKCGNFKSQISESNEPEPPYGAVEHEDGSKREKEQGCRKALDAFSEDLYGEPRMFYNQTPLQVELPKDCCTDDPKQLLQGEVLPNCSADDSRQSLQLELPPSFSADDKEIPSNHVSVKMGYQIPMQESVEKEDFEPNFNMANVKEILEAVSCGDGIDEPKKEYVEAGSSHSPTSKRKRKKKKKKTKMLKASTNLKVLPEKVTIRTHPSSHSGGGSGSANCVGATSSTGLPSYQNNVYGKANQLGGGGGDGGEDDENYQEQKATCDNKKEKKKKKSKDSKENNVEMVCVEDKKPSQDEMMVISPSTSGDASMRDLSLLDKITNSDIQHAAFCKKNCGKTSCSELKQLFDHHAECKRTQDCSICEDLSAIVSNKHAHVCGLPGCMVPICPNFKAAKRVAVKCGSPIVAQRLNHPCFLDFSPDPGVPIIFPRGNIYGGQNPNGHQNNIGLPIQARQGYASPVPYPFGLQVPNEETFRYKDPHVFKSETLEEGIHYQVVKVLGQGGNGLVEKVVIQGEVLSDQSKRCMARKKTNYKVWQQEIQIMQILSWSPEHFVPSHAVTNSTDKGDNIFMELCDDGDLKAYIVSKGGVLPPKDALFYIHQVIRCLEKMHGITCNGMPSPIIHKDIKAQNIMLSEDGTRARIGDLDAALLLFTEKTVPGLKPEGTPIFVAPEVWERKPHGTSADIYSFGILVLELTVGLPEKGLQNLKSKVDELLRLDGDLGCLVMECTRVEPEQRPTAWQILQHPMFAEYGTPCV